MVEAPSSSHNRTRRASSRMSGFRPGMTIRPGGPATLRPFQGIGPVLGDVPAVVSLGPTNSNNGGGWNKFRHQTTELNVGRLTLKRARAGKAYLLQKQCTPRNARLFTSRM